jgi:hypothetical protein
MTEETFVQLFWAIGLVVVFVGALCLGALIFESKIGRAGIAWAQQRRKVNARWSELLGPDLKDYKGK